MPHTTISTTPTSWFLRGFLVGALFCAALNALSYFFRSDGWGNLLGTTPQHREALGFPWQIWEHGNNYGGYFADYRAVAWDAAFGAAIGMVCGLIALRRRERLNRLVEEFDRTPTTPPGNFQFSLRGLMLATALVALLAAIGRHDSAARPEVLGAIYLLGPWVLVMIAFLPRRIPWQQRVMILIPAAVVMILAAVATGAGLNRSLEFDKVLLGIFICWTPQSAFVAIAVSLAIVLFHRVQPTKLDRP